LRLTQLLSRLNSRAICGWLSPSSRYSERTTQATSSSDSPLAALHDSSRTFAPVASSACTSTRSVFHDSARAARQRFTPSNSSSASPTRQACTGVNCPSFESERSIRSCVSGTHKRTAHSELDSSSGATSMLAIGSPFMPASVREQRRR
jgi:hypothetical protein